MRRGFQQRGIVEPACRRAADRDAHQILPLPREFGSVGAVGDHETRAAPREAIGDVCAGQQRRRGDHDQAELHRRQHRDPQGRDVAEHQQHPIAAPGAEPAQAVGEARRNRRELGETKSLDAVAQDFQRGPRAVFALRQLRVEPVERPVEPFRARPMEAGAGEIVIFSDREQEVARGFEFLSGHLSLRPPFA